MIINKQTEKQIKNAFRNYEKLKKEAAEYLANLATNGIATNWEHIGHGRGGYYNPTEKKALKACENEKLKWCYVVEKTLRHYQEQEQDGRGKAELIRQLFFEKKSPFSIMINLHIQERTYYYWLDEIITYAAFQAVQEGLITV
jgi:hypothetical protein